MSHYGGLPDSQIRGIRLSEDTALSSIAFRRPIPQEDAMSSASDHEHEWIPVRTFCKIIAENTNNQWSAWFPRVPEVRIFGERPTEAICKLLRHFGDGQFEKGQIHVLHYAYQHGHLEYMIPLLNDRRTPILGCGSGDLTESSIRNRLDGLFIGIDHARFEDARGYD